MARDLSKLPETFAAGQIWREDNGRLVKILDPDFDAVGPSWTYVDAAGNPEPESDEFPDWFRHYCDALDFYVWGRFEYVSD